MKGLIVAGEASGDLYGAGLSSALRRRIPSLRLAGMGGLGMKEAGVEILYPSDAVTVVGIFEVFAKLHHLRRAYTSLKRRILEDPPDFAVLIDFPDFNFRIARLLKEQKIRTFYFISPQIWAWRKTRIRFLKNHIELMICILPFEEKLYREAGVPVVYAGHPLVEMVMEEVSRQPDYLPGSRPLIGIMPGSRDTEVRRHLSILMETIRLIRRKTDVDAVLIWPPSLSQESYKIPTEVRFESTNRYAAMKACDFLLVASGTSTLESAILGVPLFIVYRVGSFSWLLGKLLVRVPYYGLVNWIAQRPCIPEYIQSRMNPELLAADTLNLLGADSRKQAMKEDLRSIVDLLGPPGAMERVANAILERMTPVRDSCL